MPSTIDKNQEFIIFISMGFKLFVITQNIILKNEIGKILILKHKTGSWLLPGGKIGEGENSINGLKRELREEIGIDQFEIEKIIDMDTWEEGGRGYCVVTFLGSIDPSDNILLSEEHTDYAWIDASKLDNYKFWNEKIKERIRKNFLQLEKQ